MAGVSGQHAAPAEIAPVDGVHHQNHFARSLLIGVIFGVFRPIAAALLNVAKSAVFTQRRGEKALRVHELLYRNAAENLNVFEILLGHQRLLCRFGLAAYPYSRQQKRHRYRQRTGYFSSHLSLNPKIKFPPPFNRSRGLSPLPLDGWNLILLLRLSGTKTIR